MGRADLCSALSTHAGCHSRTTRKQELPALCGDSSARMQAVATGSPSRPFLKVHGKISVWRPAGSIGLSSNESAPELVGTTFLLTRGFKSSIQLPTSLLPTCKSQTATLSGCVGSICFSPLETIVGRFTSLWPHVGSWRPTISRSSVCQYSSRHTKWPCDPLLPWFDLKELARLRFDPSQST
jgi:hypothetical protein